jgi:hypothetical protein
VTLEKYLVSCMIKPTVHKHGVGRHKGSDLGKIVGIMYD